MNNPYIYKKLTPYERYQEGLMVALVPHEQEGGIPISDLLIPELLNHYGLTMSQARYIVLKLIQDKTLIGKEQDGKFLVSVPKQISKTKLYY